MASKGVSVLKFVGVCSVGLYTGLSYTLSTLTLPTLLTLPNASTASGAFTSLNTLSTRHLSALAGLSSTSFILAYLLSPRSQKHPYLLWTTFLISCSGASSYLLPSPVSKPTKQPKKSKTSERTTKTKVMDASYEVVGASDHSGSSGEEVSDEESVNGEEVRGRMEGFMTKQIARTVVAAVGFAMSVVGVWGDGVVDTVIIEM
ncbi:hypothetical protein HYALB_00002930 [Hymenoscyphus albidus]|uniref:Autophagy-related protein 33 n=1 Tax=Hymenoscyphus albidus TaxID=595503 RepID=A0A9N9LXR2_9HELO|nr:hypothetical protein HYALB_00002930 [Hymenoscyphus albidus]